MAKDDPDSRPIPVSELLARQREANGAELTGEISRESFPRSSNPVAQRASGPVPGASGLPRTASGMPSHRPGAVPVELTAEEANRVTGIIPTVDDASATGSIAAPPTGAVVAPPTGAIPAPPTSGPAPVAPTTAGPATGSFLRTDDDVDFESYRNFDDVVATDEPTKKRKLGLFGRRKGAAAEQTSAAKPERERKRRATRAAGPAAADEAAAQPAVVGPVVGPDADTVVTDTVVTSGESAAAAIPPVEETTTLSPIDPDDMYEDQIPVGAPLVDPVTGRFALPGTAPRVERPAPAAKTPAIVPSATRRVAEVASAAAAPVSDTPAPVGESRQARRARTAQVASDTDVVDEAPLASRHSPTMQWLMIIGQSLAGLILGAAGFWGFVQLWRWNVYFALVLAAVVIFGIVTLVHLVRRRHDLATTLLALGVGLLITLGPLVVLATS